MTKFADYSNYNVPVGEDPLNWVRSLTGEILEAEASNAEDMRVTRKCDPMLPVTRYELAEAIFIERAGKDLK